MRLLAIICFCFSISAGMVTAGEAQQTDLHINRETQALQQQMMNDEEILNMIQSLQNDPDFQQVLQDPEIMKAVSSGDIATLMANPKFMRILDNKTVRDIGTKLQK
jgi:hypothetical protein